MALQPVPMRYVIRTDPYVERAHQRLAGTDEAVPPARASAHIWEQDLPADLGLGLHSVVVQTEDEFGQRRRGVLTFELVEASLKDPFVIESNR